MSVNHFYTIDLRNAPEIQWIVGFQSSVLQKGLDNPRRYFVSRTCKEIVVTNGTTRYVLSIPTGNYTYLEFIEAVDSDELGEGMTGDNLSIDVIEQSNLDCIDCVLTNANDNLISLNSSVYISFTISCYTKVKNGWVHTYNSLHSIQTSQSEIEKHDGQDVESILR